MIAIEKGLIKEKDLKKLKFEYTIFDNDAEINSANIVVSKKKDR
ncbi:hypothetical protein JCM30566_07800 [Marinitoga arctica]